jgi:cell division septation protein DedD
MSAPEGRRAAESPSCPLLGLPDDQLSRFSYPSVGHRCRADDRPRPIDLGHQAAFCLTAMYPECPRYRAAAVSRRPGAATPAASGVALERARADAGGPGTLGKTGAIGGPGTPGGPGAIGGPGAPGEPGRQPPARTSRWRRVVAIGLAVAVLAGAAYFASPAIADWMQQMGAGASAASPSPSTSPPATPAPTLSTPASTPTATRARTATPSPTPTPAATPQVHVVVRGQTLISIAARYGVTAAAIKKANGITGAGLIYVGQHLIIPPR